MNLIKFSPDPSKAQFAIVVSFDLSAFSDFCNRDDAHLVLPKFLSRLFDQLNGLLLQGWEAALKNIGDLFRTASERDKVVRPEYIKFTGDGALMVWLPGSDGRFSEEFRSTLVMAMRNLQSRIRSTVPEWEKEWGLSGLPNKTRFGIAAGHIYGLSEPSSYSLTYLEETPVEYVGYFVNLAVRLQDHCKDLGFLVHESVHPS